MKKFLIILILFFAFENYNAQNIFYVSSATDISEAMNSAQPGDTLIMNNGNWVNQQIKFIGNGTAENPIVLKAEKGGYVAITGKSNLRIAGSYLVVSGLNFFDGYSPSGAVVEFRSSSSNLAQNCRLTNTSITDFNPPNLNDDNKWISLYGKYNRVDHCYIAGKRNSGTTLVVWMDSEPDYHLIDSNYFGHRPVLGYNGGETIRIGTSSWSMLDSRCIVEYNLFEKCDGETEIISNKSGHNIYRYNTFVESEGTLTLRHGNNCEVYSNFFFGNNKSSVGGIRVIGENHKVYNNYLQDIPGTGYRAAICLVEGVPDSPLNRYFQVKNAQIVNNTIVHCSQPFSIGYGSSSDQSLPPEDMKIVNNVVVSDYQIIRYYDEPINPLYSQNMVFNGPVGISPIPDGIIQIDPQLQFASDSLFRPIEASPVINAGDNGYDFVSDDFDGQPRNQIDIGADEYSDLPILRKPIKAEDVGPDWFPLPEVPPTVVQVSAGRDSLLSAVNNAEPGIILELIDDGGDYVNSAKISIDKNVIIKAKSGLVNPPVVSADYSSSASSIFEIKDGGNLEIKGIELNGKSSSENPAKYLIKTDETPFAYQYSLTVDSCIFKNVIINGNEGNFFRAYPGTKAAKIALSNSQFYNCGAIGFRLNEETENSGNYNAEKFSVYNCLFFDIPEEAINIYAGDDVPFTPGPKLLVDHSTFYNCGMNSTPVLLPEEADSTIISNCIIAESSPNTNSLRLFGINSEIRYCDIWNSGAVEINRGAAIGKKVIDYNPLFQDANQNDFVLLPESPVLLRGEGKTAMGDLNLAANSPVKYPLDVFISGNGNVSVSPANEYFLYEPGESVMLTAIADSGYEFREWTGDINGSGNPLNILALGAIEITAVFDKINSSAEEKEIPRLFKLYQNYPNPFNPSTFIKYSLPEAGYVTLEMFNLLGQKIRTLATGYHSAGQYSVMLDAGELSSGIYLIRLKFNDKAEIIKINLLR